VAGVAVREAQQTVLVLGLGVPDLGGRGYLGDDFARPEPAGPWSTGCGSGNDAGIAVVVPAMVRGVAQSNPRRNTVF
jgi:hypothetical protein